MDVGDSAKTIDLTPGTTNGVLFDGMTADGSKVFFTTKDTLSTAANQDTDASADIYEAEVSGESATLTRISTGQRRQPATPTPAIRSPTQTANTGTRSAQAKNCGVVAIGGGGGVGRRVGSIYFLSPEQLDGSSNGTENQPNLYLAAPGSAPRFIATLSPEDAVVLDAVKEAETRTPPTSRSRRAGNTRRLRRPQAAR